jgi:hypothetical protein
VTGSIRNARRAGIAAASTHPERERGRSDEGDRIGRARAPHQEHRPRAGDEPGGSRHRRELAFDDADLRDQHVLDLETRVEVAGARQVPHEKQRGYEQDERHRDLSHDEKVAQRPPSSEATYGERVLILQRGSCERRVACRAGASAQRIVVTGVSSVE